ncbi:MAG: superoxide dismutase family protein, partial [Calditrichaceae bacterium]
MFTKSNLRLSLFSLLFLFLISACSKQDKQVPVMKPEMKSGISKAVAVIHPTKGNSVHGTVYFEKVPEGIKVIADISGLSPGKHGFHIHEFGDCTAEDATSAGGHFNPENKKHGGPNS